MKECANGGRLILRAYDALWQSLEANVYSPKEQGDRYKIQYHDQFNQKSGFRIEFADSLNDAKRMIEERQGAVTFR